MSKEEKGNIKEYQRERYKQLIQCKKEALQKSEQPINLDLVNVDQIVISDKCKHSDDGFKYFIGYI